MRDSAVCLPKVTEATAKAYPHVSKVMAIRANLINMYEAGFITIRFTQYTVRLSQTTEPVWPL